MEQPQAYHLAAEAVDLDSTSFSAANTGVHHDVHASEFIEWDTTSTLNQADNALQRMEEQIQATWTMLLEQESSWAKTMTPASYASRTLEVQGHNPCALQRLDFEMPMVDIHDKSAESTWACRATLLFCQSLAGDMAVVNSP